MREYYVEVVEIFKKKVPIKAESKIDAKEKAEKDYHDKKISLKKKDIIKVDFLVK